MLFSSLECTQRGRVALPPGHRGGAVHADDFGGVWVITADGQAALYYAAAALEAAMHQPPPTALTGSFSSPAAAPSAPPPPTPFTVAYRCRTDGDRDGAHEEPPATPIEPADRIHSLRFFHHDTASDVSSPRDDVCLVTAGGTLVFLRVPGAAGAVEAAAETLLQPYQEVHLGMRVSATAAMRGAVALCCDDGAYTEVIHAAVVPDGEAAGEVDAVGLFRVGGRVPALLYDAVQDTLVSVSDDGNVDVWDVARGRDVTAAYGSLSWEPRRHGSPTCALLCDDRLWVGLSTGHVLVFAFTPQPRMAASPAEAPHAAQLLRSHTSSVTGLLRMSLGTSVWGCAADSAKVNVWDAQSADLRGSFVFPEAGLAAWQAGAAQVRTAVWGIDAATGQPSLLHVTQALTDPSGTHVRTRDAVSREQGREALLRAYEVCWRAVVRALNVPDCREGDGAGDEEDASDEAVEVALAFVQGEAGDGAEAPPGVLASLRAVSTGLRRLCATRRWGDGAGEPADVPAVMAECVAGCEERDRLAHAVQAMLRSVNAAAGAAEPPLTSLEDAADELVHLRGRVDALEQALSSRTAKAADDAAAAAAVEEATGHLQSELQAAQEALREEREGHRALRALLEETQRELETVTAQHAEAQRLLASSAEEADQLKRSLLAAKRAAEVTTSEVSTVFEMESRLHESQGVVAELSAKVDRLLNASEDADAQLRAFEEKQSAAKAVLQRVLHTQNALADDVGGLVDVVGGAVRRLKKVHRCEPGGPVAELVETVETAMYDTELSVEKRLRDQQVYFHSLAHELAAAIT